jgi:hypothetical protein
VYLRLGRNEVTRITAGKQGEHFAQRGGPATCCVLISMTVGKCSNRGKFALVPQFMQQVNIFCAIFDAPGSILRQLHMHEHVVAVCNWGEPVAWCVGLGQ